jgi:uncharacterized protein YpmB
LKREKKKMSKRIWMIIGIILVAVIVVIGGGYAYGEYRHINGHQTGYDEGYQNAEKSLGITVEEAKTKMEELGEERDELLLENAQLEEENDELFWENAELSAKLGPVVEMGEHQTVVTSVKEVADFASRFFSNVGTGARDFRVLESLETVKEFLLKDSTTPYVSMFPDGSEDIQAFHLREAWEKAGLPMLSIGLLKLREGGEVIWRVIFIAKENGKLAMYELNFTNDELTKIQGPMSNVLQGRIGTYAMEP